MGTKQWLYTIAGGAVLVGIIGFGVVDGAKRQAAQDAQDKLTKWHVWDLSNNDEQYWKDWSLQRNYYADRIIQSGMFTFGNGPPPMFPTSAEEYLSEYDNPDRTRMLLNERLDMNEFQKVNAEFLKRYPIISLDDRLHYEDDRNKPDDNDVNELAARKLATRMLHDQWNEYYRVTEINDLTPDRPLPHQDRLSRGRRHEALETLHREGLKAFANVTAFGFDRTPRIDLHDLRFYDVPELVQLPQNIYVRPSPGYPVDLEGDYDSLKDAEKWVLDNLRKDYPKYMHLAFYHQFTEDDNYVASFRQAAGFHPHAVRDVVSWRYDLFRPISNPGWHVQRMELVSLLKFDKPAVYVSDMLPNMKQLVDGKTRPLDEFESEALKKIYDGEFIITQGNDKQLRMVGAVRAGETCIECHAVKSGELLGAFSYLLQR